MNKTSHKVLCAIVTTLAAFGAWAETQFAYTVTDGEVTITGASNIGGYLDIPDTIDGYPVVSIGNRAFNFELGLEHLNIPDGIKNIGEYAFSLCHGMEELIIPDSVTNIGHYAFYKCYDVERIEIGSGVKTIGNWAFGECYALSELHIAHGVETIDEYAFGTCYCLESVTLPSSVKNLKWGAFANIAGLQTAYIHASTKKSKGVFENSPNVEVRYYNCQTPAAPPPVENQSATTNGPRAIRVDWDFDGSAEVSGFKVYRATTDDFGTATLVAEEGWSSFEDYDVVEGPNYFYWVVPVNDIFAGETSGPACGSCVGPLEITATGVLHGVELSDFMQELSEVSGSDFLEWYVDGDANLPPGIALFGYGALGVLSGIPTQYGTYTFTVHCKDWRFESSEEATAEITVEILENDNRKPTIAGCSPSGITDVVLKDVTQQEFIVSAHDPDGQNVNYVWTIDGEEVLSGDQATNLVFDSSCYMDNAWGHEIVCYVNDDLWTNIVHRQWMVYIPQTFYVDADNGSDDNDGLTSETAFASISMAVGAASPYCTIHVASGTYHEGISIGMPVTIDATNGLATIKGGIFYGGGNEYAERPIIRGFIVKSVYVAAEHVDMERCVITGCGEMDGYYGGEVEFPGILHDCTLSRCTIAGNTTTPEHPLMVNCSYDETTIVWGNDDENDEVVDPEFVSLSNDDCRLRTSSPYVANGIATRGALDDVVSGHVISASVVGPGSLDKMVEAVEDGGSVTFSVAVGSHPIDHFEVNGESVVASGNSYTFSNVASDATLTAFFVSNITFYVDAANGNDAADGFTKATAVATLQEAVDRTVDGDTIIVADGTYAPVHVGDKRITIESENGYKTTIIDGGGTNGCIWAEYNVIGFSFPSTNMVVRGFTLTNGYEYHGAGAYGGTLEHCLIASNIAHTDGPTHGEDQGRSDGKGGGAYGSAMRYCTIIGNSAEFWQGDDGNGEPYALGGEGGGVYGCTLENCIVYGNDGEIAPDAFNYEYSSDSLIGVDPLFVNAANDDYRLTRNSPAVVEGVVTAGCESEVVEPKTLYVDAANGNDSADGLSRANAVKTLQTAIDRAVDGDTILVADSTYAPIHVGDKRITIESENGYKTTIIDGGGTNGCASFWHVGTYYWDQFASTNAMLRGFTLRNGRASEGAGALGGTLERCLIVCNVACNEETPQGLLFGQGGGTHRSMLRYCTVVGNAAEAFAGYDGAVAQCGGVYGCTLENCIVYGNDGVISPNAFDSEYSDDSLVGEDPFFVDAVNGDYRLMSSSPCVVNGVATAGCETEIMSGTVPELTPAQASAWISNDLALRYAKSGESAADYQSRFEAKFGSDPVAAMSMPTDKKDAQGNNMYVWQDYVAGTDPTDTNSVFTATITMVDGAPVVTWSPKLNAAEEARRSYTIYGKTNLTDKAWHSPTNESSRFFSVGVEMK